MTIGLVLVTENVIDSATARRTGPENGLRQATQGCGGGGQLMHVNLIYKHLEW